jgi:hypothetical protein
VSQWRCRQSGAGSGDRVDSIRFAGAMSCLTVRPINLDHRDAFAGQVPCDAGPVRTGALDPGQPTNQVAVACGGCGEGLDAEESAVVIDCGCDVEVGVGVDPGGDRERGGASVF